MFTDDHAIFKAFPGTIASLIFVCAIDVVSPRSFVVGFYYNSGISDLSAKHAPADYLIMMTVRFGSSDMWQLACGIISAKMYFRNKSSTVWGAWKELNSTTL